jgi:hypothetical protein
MADPVHEHFRITTQLRLASTGSVDCVMHGSNASRALHAAAIDMHEFHADRDHAMYNIQSRTIPAVQLAQLQKLS